MTQGTPRFEAKEHAPGVFHVIDNMTSKAVAKLKTGQPVVFNGEASAKDYANFLCQVIQGTNHPLILK
jgi:hypothetical protein